MFYFDEQCEPPTAFEIKDTQVKLKHEKKQQLKYSCASDALHGLVFFSLYYFNFISGKATLITIIFATICALVLTNYVHQPLSTSDKVSIAVTAIGVFLLSLLLLIWWMKQEVDASIIASAAGGSIVLIGSILGRKVKQVLNNLEDLKPVHDDCSAKKELANLTRHYPEVATYRDQALQILRPNLTYGELKAIRVWADEKCNNEHVNETI